MLDFVNLIMLEKWIIRTRSTHVLQLACGFVSWYLDPTFSLSPPAIFAHSYPQYLYQ